MTIEFMDEFERAIDAAARDDSIRALVIAVAGVLRCVVGAGDSPLVSALAGSFRSVRARD